MHILIISLQAVSILLGLGFIGFWVIGRRRVPGNVLGFLSVLAIDIAAPGLVLSSMLTGFSPETFPGWWVLPLYWFGFTAVAFVLSLAGGLTVSKTIRGEFTMSLLFQNGLFFPLIILTGLFGKDNVYLVPLFVFTILQPPLVFSTYSLFFKSNNSGPRLNWKRVVNPVLVATLLGVIMGLARIRTVVPEFIITMLVMLGAMAAPLFMLILGGNVYNDLVTSRQTTGKFYISEVVKFVVIKNILFPLIFLGLLIWFRPDPVYGFIIILQAAVPPITSIPIFTERSGGNRAITSQFILASFIFSIFSIPAMIFLFSRFFSVPLG